jgi:DNA processing protein
MTPQFLLHLSLIPGIGPVAIKPFYTCAFSEEQLYRFSITDFQNFFHVSEHTAQLLVSGLADKKLLEKELALLEQYGIHLITFMDLEYPVLLKKIHAPPPVLYVQGTMNADLHALAMVGSRKADNYGKRIITSIVPDLITHGLTLVSGGAIGADALVHEEVLRNKGKTLAVIGSGLLKPYPSSNRYLFERIQKEGGAIISPFPLTMQALPGNFPARNRIIAGMSFGCIVVQAAAQSGALITARYALDEGRHVYAIPGQFDDPLSAGCHLLLTQGASLVTGAQDILTSLQDNGIIITAKVPFSEKLVKISPVQTGPMPLTPQNILVGLCQQPQSLDELIELTGLTIGQLSQQLFELQLDGHLEQDFNGSWKQKSSF